jgi:hypothetical protein
MPTPAVFSLTGTVHDNGTAILCFQGPANHVIDWRIISGSALLTPLGNVTDQFGRASCKFDAVGIAGLVVVGVAYIP